MGRCKRHKRVYVCVFMTTVTERFTVMPAPDRNRTPRHLIPITREIEARVLELVRSAMSCTDIGRQLGISKASVSLLARGKFRWSSRQAERPPLAETGSPAAIRAGRRPFVSPEIAAQVPVLVAQGMSLQAIGLQLGISRTTASLLARGLYKVSS
jgi:DNA-binding CsgD family transcriptional regulator